jgi:sugar/nucleoside kinase (ribokinase family)
MAIDLLLVGSVAYDSVETPRGKADRALGGSATYAAIAASYFCRPGIVAVVGSDFGVKDVNVLKRRGVDLEGLQKDTSGDTFYWAGYYEGDMNRAHTRVTHLNVFEHFDPVIPDSYRNAPHVLLGNIHPSLQLKVLDQVRKPKLVLCDTMNYWIESEPKLLTEVFKRVNVICINEDEACQFCGTNSLIKAAEQLMKLGPKRIVIKKGIHGVVMFGRKSFFSLPAIPIAQVIDPTGAGDSFAGGTLGRLAKARAINDNAFRRALVAGTVMASYCVEDFSCRKTAKLTQRAIKSRTQEIRNYTRIP